MANAVEKVNGIAIADIQAINGITDDNLQALNTLEFTGTIPDAHTLIATATSDGSDATLSFVDGTNGVVFDSTYDVYEFVFTNIHPQTDNVQFEFQVNATDDAGGGYDTSLITSTFFDAYHDEADSTTALGYQTSRDLAQSASHQQLARGLGTDNDQSASGVLTIYGPSSTTYVKHFTARFQNVYYADYSMETNIAGYINDTTAIDEISFKMSSGEIQGGEIKMYGLAKS